MKTERPDPDDVEEAVRSWGRRDPKTPAAVAAARVLDRVRSSRKREPRPALWALIGATAAVAAVMVIHGSLDRRPAAPAWDELPPPLPSNVVVSWIDAKTPVYFVMGPMTR